MTFETGTHIAKGMRFPVRTWKCCGNIWELLISKRTFKYRVGWKPICPDCGSTYERKFVKPKPRYDDVFEEGVDWLDSL